MKKPSIRASNMGRSLACPGSRTVAALVPIPQGTDGHEGEWCHRQTALLAIEQLGATGPEGGLPPVSFPPTLKTGYIAWIPALQLRFLRDTIPAVWSLMVEVEMEAEFERWISTGHADVVAISPDGTEAIGVDWKDGRIGVGPAEFSWQFLTYAVQMKLTWPTLTKITFWAVQPMLEDDDDHPRYSSFVLEGADLDAAVTSLNNRAETALAQPRKLVDGEHCKYCVGLSCPNLRKELEFMETELTDEMIAELKDGMNDQKVADLFLSAKILAKPLKDFDDLVNARLEATGSLAASDGRRITAQVQNAGIKVTDPVEYSRVVRELIPDADKLASATRYSIEPLVELIAAETGAPKGGKSGASARNILDARTAPFFEVRTKTVKRVSL